MDKVTEQNINALAKQILDYGRREADIAYLRGVEFGMGMGKNFALDSETIDEATSQMTAYLKGMEVLVKSTNDKESRD